MDLQTYYLEAQSPFHLGERGIGLEATTVIARADTLFSALCMTYRTWYGVEALEDMLAAFQSDPPVLFSSAFPYVMINNDPLRLYPKPLGTPPHIAQDDLDVFKTLKKVEFVSEAIWRLWLSGDASLREHVSTLGATDSARIQSGRVWFTAEEAERVYTAIPRDLEGQINLWKTYDVPRVTVDRLSSSSAVYQAGRVSFSKGSGLWFGLQWRHGDWFDELGVLLEVLGDEGLGGERSAGHGQFYLAGKDLLTFSDPGNKVVTLSPYWPPDQAEAGYVLDQPAAYTLMMRRGWMGSPEGSSLRRKAVRMVGEGSVLNMPDRPTIGGLVDVTPDGFSAHRVYRYGYALPVGMN